MKILIGLSLLISTASFASVENCEVLAGNYSCSHMGDTVVLGLIVDSAANTIEVDIAGEGGLFIVDGELNQSETGDTQYEATCSEQSEFTLKNYFHDEFKGQLIIEPIDNGVMYNLLKRDRIIQIPCIKN